MPVKVKKGQSRNQYMDSCMHEITHRGKKKRTHEQRIAICLSSWRKQTNEDAILDRMDLLMGEEHKCPKNPHK